MIQLNDNYQHMPKSYLFTEVGQRLKAFTAAHPDEAIIKLSLGDVSRPIVPAVIEAMHKAVAEMGTYEGFHGYGPEEGYAFLKEAIVKGDFESRGVEISTDEIFVSDGAKNDCANLAGLFTTDNVLAVCDPVYPAYLEFNGLAGRNGVYDEDTARWSRVIYMPCVESNGFAPDIPAQKADMIYLCFPNNPTGAIATKERLKEWVDYANRNGSIIFFDAAYEVFITDPELPHSIYEIEGAKTCAIELRSFSKTAGFTGVRCAYCVVPKELERHGVSLNRMWDRRVCGHTNGVPYVTQRAAEAVYTPEGRAQCLENIAYYQKNAQIILDSLRGAGYECFGGANAPYIWMKTPGGMDSWDYFDLLLNKAHVATTPGVGFGPCGQGFIRLTSFGTEANTREAVKRIISL